MDTSKCWLGTGASLAGLAVILGAFGAHFIGDMLVEKYEGAEPKMVAGFEVPVSWKRFEDYKTAVDYQMYHALGMIVVGLMSASQPRKLLEAAGWSFLLGIVLFSGSLYAITFTGQTWWGMLAPIGGTLFIVGWTLLAIAGCGHQSNAKSVA